MHRLILGLSPADKVEVDHINHNGLDNRRCNLRICTKEENQHNQRVRPKGTSKYKGVYWSKRDKRWKAQINFMGKRIGLGHYTIEKLAALAYDFAALKYYREFAVFNF